MILLELAVAYVETFAKELNRVVAFFLAAFTVVIEVDHVVSGSDDCAVSFHLSHFDDFPVEV